MPIFEYQCLNCKKKFEKLVYNKDKINCPFCRSFKIKKNISKISIGGKSCSGCKGNCSNCSSN